MIPWAAPSITISDEESVKNALISTWISGGPHHKEFTLNLNNFLETKNIALTNNGTSALAIAFLALGVKPNDKVVVPAFGFMAAANVLLQMNAIPVFADVDPLTWCISRKTLEQVIDKDTKAVVVTHTYGNHNDILEICDYLKNEWNIPLIEDTAEAIGSVIKGRSLGTIGDFGTFSFHATKLITTGEGGAITWKNNTISEMVSLIISHGLDRKLHYQHKLPGSNFRMANLNAALGLSQLKRIRSLIDERSRIDNLYRTMLSEAEAAGKFRFQVFGEGKMVPWSFPMKTNLISREEVHKLVGKLSDLEVEIRPGFATPNYLSYMNSSDISSYPAAKELSDSLISLPAFPGLSEMEVASIVEKVMRVL
jgi:perosamine synthetase